MSRLIDAAVIDYVDLNDLIFVISKRRKIIKLAYNLICIEVE